jgi:hypothetical protein
MPEGPSPTHQEQKTRRKLLDIVDFGEFRELIKDKPPLRTDEISRQILSVESFLANRQRKCQSIWVESHYIDRAFMDEYREFYATSYLQYESSCTRLHFFTETKESLAQKIRKLEEELAAIDSKSEWLVAQNNYLKLCRAFSNAYYLGFMVVKPLPATRIGRTVLRHPRHEKSSASRALFPCTKFYTAHISGLELSVCGLPFQQQDGGMSACASTALWASLSQSSEFEHFQVPSPAAITRFASSHKTNFGRSIPQGGTGLTSAQMTQAIEAAGLSPYMLTLKKLRAREVRSLVYSAIRSGFAPMLLLSDKNETEKHVVTVAGALLEGEGRPDQEKGFWATEESSRISALYINDDRVAPYHQSPLADKDLDLNDENSPWQITHMLVPLHPKIRFAFNELYRLATENVLFDIDVWCASTLSVEISEQKPLELGYQIQKGRAYRQKCLFGPSKLSSHVLQRLNAEFGFPRYIGVIQVDHPGLGSIEMIVDATNTVAHLKVLMILGRQNITPKGEQVIQRLSRRFGGRALIATQAQE